VLTGAVFGIAAVPGASAGAADRLPDLRMTPLRDIRITVENGRRLLRFTAMMSNVGQGHFEVRGFRSSTSDPTMSFDQIIFNSDGGYRRVGTDAWGQYAGDGHDHWHVQRMMSYGLWPAAGSTSMLRGAKVGFCFLDTNPWKLSLPGARQNSYYRESWCGTKSSLTNRVGISLGWADSYPWNFAYQWVNITGVAAGDYYLRSVVDENDYFFETNDGNNCAWAKIRIPASGSVVSVLSTGTTCPGPATVLQFPGVITYAGDRRITFAPGEHTGYRFASNGSVTSRYPKTLTRTSGADATHAATIPGQSGQWFYIRDGIWAGSWIQQSASVVPEPLRPNADSFPGTSAVPAGSRIDLAAGDYRGFRFTDAGLTIESKWYRLGRGSGAPVDQRGALPGRPGTWLHIAAGIWADYWMQESPTAVFHPPAP
jgi:hypothetical protein